MATKKKPIDWEAIEREYRAGQLSVVEIGRQHGVSHTAIQKRAKRDGWKRDLAKQVRREVSARLVSPEVAAANAQQAIDDAAARAVEVVREHRKDIRGGRQMVGRLMDELNATTSHLGEMEAAIVDETDEDKTVARRGAMMKAISLPSRAGVIRDLSQAMKNLIGLERQAFSLDGELDGSDDPARTMTDADLDAEIRRLSGK